MQTWVSFWMVREGERFRFVYSPTLNPRVGDQVFVKGKGGWFRSVGGGRAYRTGKYSAVTTKVKEAV